YTATLGSISSEKLLSLQTVIVAGEPCPSSLADIHFKTLPNTKLYNEYGPTETTVWATADEIELAEGATSVPIGKPIANTKAYVLDKGLNRVPVGVAGELYIGGKGVAQGYFNKPKLTEERFLQNPFDRAGRLYRTGDVCRFRSDGKLEYLGRTDEQIKLRGYRIELGEIQETFRRIPNIRDVIVRLERLERNHNESDDEMSLSDSLAKMNNDEADKLLRSVEVLSDREILFMLNEMETS
ncbi:MAG: AMP-binding protein, partial [Pyrinomonadaceae bacterium]|nr:AMP-binding protein [Pyrinomonadaceae bacterium]